jgi:RNA polymerase subunit RPABC4/transcription elongation factor Spt4
MNRRTFATLVAGFVITALIAWIVVGIALDRRLVTMSPSDEAAGRVIFHLGATLACLVLWTLVGIGIFVYHDARQRGMPPVLWTLVAIFVPYFVGLIIYLIVRQTRQPPCPACGAATPGDAMFCPRCGGAIQLRCSKCQGRLPREARFCPSCGAAATP